jgi:hypothetical protein
MSIFDDLPDDWYDPIEVFFAATELSPQQIGNPKPTIQSNLLVEVGLPGTEESHEFLIGMKTDGWYICIPAPCQQSHSISEWDYDDIGPFPTREVAIEALPVALGKHIQSTRKYLEELEEQIGWLRDNPDRWRNSDWIPNPCVRPELHIIKDKP